MNAITLTVFIGEKGECSLQWRGDGSWEGWLAYQRLPGEHSFYRRPDLDRLSTAGVSTAMERARDHPEDAMRWNLTQNSP